MTNLPLTKRQKQRLLIMAKALFPEFKKGGTFNMLNHLHEPGEYENTIDELSKAETNFVAYYCFGQPLLEDESADEHCKKWFGSMHWFEFCMTWLKEAIYFTQPYKHDNIRKALAFDSNTNWYWYYLNIEDKEESSKNIDSYLHPVDYLYKEFKSISNAS